MPELLLYRSPAAVRPTIIEELLKLARSGQQEAVNAAILMLADFYLNGTDSRYAKKLQGLPIWELKTQSRGGAKGGTRVYFFFRPTGVAVIAHMEVKTGDAPGAALGAALLAWRNDTRTRGAKEE